MIHWWRPLGRLGKIWSYISRFYLIWTSLQVSSVFAAFPKYTGEWVGQWVVTFDMKGKKEISRTFQNHLYDIQYQSSRMKETLDSVIDQWSSNPIDNYWKDTDYSSRLFVGYTFLRIFFHTKIARSNMLCSR